MKVRFVLLVFLCTCVLVSLCGCGYWSTSGGGGGGGGGGSSATVIGTVFNTIFNPLFGVSAVLGSLSTNTISDGTYQLKNVASGTKIISLNKSGYTTSYRRVTAEALTTTYVELAILAPLDSKITPLGSSGGQATNTSGSIRIVVPSGALSSTTNISLTEVPLMAAPYPPPIGYQFIAVIVYITPNTTTLNSDVTLYLPNLTSLPDNTEVAFYSLNTSSLVWERILNASGEASATNGVISAKIDTFGWLAAILPIAPSAGTITGRIYNADTGAGISKANVWRSYLVTLADNSGYYTISNVPTGDAVVYAVKQGFGLGSGEVTLSGGDTQILNIPLSPLIVGTIEGYIKNSINFAAISGARVALSDGRETTTEATGFYYFRNVAVGSYVVSAYANNYISNSDNTDVTEGSSVQLNIDLTPSGEATEWADGFETDRGWQITSVATNPLASWQRKEDVFTVIDSLAQYGYVVTPDDPAFLPEAKTGNYCYWYGQIIGQGPPQGCYIYNQASGDTALSGGKSEIPYNYGNLISPTIDIRNFAYATLSFDTWWEIEGVNPARGYDLMKVQISSNGGNWQDIAVLNPISDPTGTKEAYRPYSSGGYNQEGLWVSHSFDLTPYVGNIVQLRFSFNTRDELYNGFRGWCLDNFAINPSRISASQVSSASVLKRSDRGKIQTIVR